MDIRQIYAANLLYYFSPTIFAVLFSFFRLFFKKIYLTTFLVEVILIGLVAGEIRLPLGGKTFITGINELILFFMVAFIIASLPFLKRIVCPVPKNILFIWLLLTLLLTISTIGYSENLLRSIRGLMLIFEEIIITVTVSSFIIYHRNKNSFKFFEILPIVAIIFLVGGLMLTLDYKALTSLTLVQIIKYRLFIFPLGTNNTAAGVAALFFVLSAGLALGKKSKLYGLAALIFIGIVLLANSRNGLITSIFGFFFFIFISKIKIKTKLITIFTVILTVYIVFLSGLINTQIERLLFIDNLQQVRGFWGGRTDLWLQSLEYFYKYPILGTGIYNLPPFPGTETDTFLSHNLFFQELVSGGIIGFSLRMILLVLIFSYGFVNVRKFNNPELTAVFAAIASGLLFSLFEAYFYTNHQMPVFFTFVGIMFALIYKLKREKINVAGNKIDV